MLTPEQVAIIDAKIAEMEAASLAVGHAQADVDDWDWSGNASDEAIFINGFIGGLLFAKYLDK